MSEEKLKPCPFCGGKAVASTYYIECESCDVAPNIDWWHFDRDEAIKAWNTRTPQSKQ